MKIFKNFKCTVCDKVDERFVHTGVNEVVCDCGERSVKTISTPKYFGNSVGKSPSA